MRSFLPTHKGQANRCLWKASDSAVIVGGVSLPPKSMKIKQSELEQIDRLVEDSEAIIKDEIIDQKKLEIIAQQLDDMLVEMGNFRRFFKRLG